VQAASSFIVEPVAIDLESAPRPLRFQELFGNSNPVEVEIGMGKGTFIVGQARLRPGVNFLGLEYANWFWRYASDRLRRAGCRNVRTARAEAAYFFAEFVPDSSLQAVHVYFPDPWPKARHHKRRLINDRFLETVRQKLVRGGVISVVTDHAGYWEQIEAVFRASRLNIEPFARPHGVDGDEVVGTNFERKYTREGRAFHAISGRNGLPSSPN
jgi:tRNA (guanine-N7-)-methyltransferase